MPDKVGILDKETISITSVDDRSDKSLRHQSSQLDDHGLRGRQCYRLVQSLPRLRPCRMLEQELCF